MLILQFYIVWEYLKFCEISMDISQSTWWWLSEISRMFGFFPQTCVFNSGVSVSCIWFLIKHMLCLLSLFSPIPGPFGLVTVFIYEILGYSYLIGGWSGEQIAAFLTVIETYKFSAITFLCPMSPYNWVHYSRMTVRRYCKLKVSIWRLVNGLVYTL